MDVGTVALGAAGAFLLLALTALWLLRVAQGEAGRLRAEGEARLRELGDARTALEVARAEGLAQARLLAEREEALAGAQRLHEAARAACGDAESRCAKAEEAARQLDATMQQLRKDQAEATRLQREEAAATLSAVRAEGQRTAERLQEVQGQLSALQAEHSALQTERDERLASAEREMQRLGSLREEMTKEFQNLAAKTLRDTGTQFSETHQAKLVELLTPFREQVNRFEAELREVHTTAKVDRELLAQQIVNLTSKTDAVSQEALNLTRALKGDKQRQGAWGEVRLEEYLVHMGLQRDVHYFVQATRRDEDGNDYRPDFILKMPDGKCIVLDSKVSLVSYAAAMDATTEEERAQHLRDHVIAVKSHIKLLSEKAYQLLEQGSVNWVMMFMPIEGAISAAWTHEADIGTFAMDRNIGIAYPTTLLMALKTFDQLWKIEQRNKNADRIADRAGKLFDKFALVVESFRKVGTSIEAARGAHSEAMGRLNNGSGNLGWQINELKKLGAKTTKSLALTFDGDTGEEEPRILGLPSGDGPTPTHPSGDLPAE